MAYHGPEAPDDTTKSPLIFVASTAAAIFSALEAAARGEAFALLHPDQVLNGYYPAVPARPLRADASQRARELIDLRVDQGDFAILEAAADLLGIAVLPAAIYYSAVNRVLADSINTCVPCQSKG